MNELDLVNFIGNNGVAAGVAWYVLSRINPNLERIADTLNKLEHRIDRLEDILLKETQHHEEKFKH